MGIDKYKKAGFRDWQIEEIKEAIRCGLKEDIIDKWIADPMYGADQMREIRLGLIAGIDVSTYAKENISSKDMRHIREKLLVKKDEENSEELKEEKEQKRVEIKERKARIHLITAKSLLIFVPAAIAIGLLLFIIFYGKDIFTLVNTKLFIDLISEEVTINVGDEFDPYSEIKSYSSVEGASIFIDTTKLDLDEIGYYYISYNISNGLRSASASLKVNVIDNEAPSINLKQETVTLEEGSSFICSNYYDLSDNYDNEIQSNCSVLDTNSIGEHDVTITAKDNSGNSSEKTIKVIISEKRPEIIYRDPPTDSSDGDHSNINHNQNSSSSNEPSYQVPDQENNEDEMISDGGSNTPFISGQLSYSVPVGTSTSDFVFMVSSNISTSSTVTISFEEVNLGVEGTYPFTIKGTDGATATGTVTVY